MEEALPEGGKSVDMVGQSETDNLLQYTKQIQL